MKDRGNGMRGSAGQERAVRVMLRCAVRLGLFAVAVIGGFLLLGSIDRPASAAPSRPPANTQAWLSTAPSDSAGLLGDRSRSEPARRANPSPDPTARPRSDRDVGRDHGGAQVRGRVDVGRDHGGAEVRGRVDVGGTAGVRVSADAELTVERSGRAASVRPGADGPGHRRATVRVRSEFTVTVGRHGVRSQLDGAAAVAPGRGGISTSARVVATGPRARTEVSVSVSVSVPGATAAGRVGVGISVGHDGGSASPPAPTPPLGVLSGRPVHPDWRPVAGMDAFRPDAPARLGARLPVTARAEGPLSVTPLRERWADVASVDRAHPAPGARAARQPRVSLLHADRPARPAPSPRAPGSAPPPVTAGAGTARPGDSGATGLAPADVTAGWWTPEVRRLRCAVPVDVVGCGRHGTPEDTPD